MSILEKNVREKEIVHTSFLFVAIIILLVLTFFFFLPFLGTLFMAGVITTVVYPAVGFLRSKNFSKAAAVISVFLGVILTIVIPAFIFTSTLLGEASDVSKSIITWSQNLPEKIQTGLVELPFVSAESGVLQELDFSTLNQLATDVAGKVSGSLVSSATIFATKLATMLLHLFIFFFALFYLLIDGEKVVAFVKRLLPLDAHQTDELINKTRDLMESITYGIVGAALAQGLTLGLGLAIVGVDNPIFWATLAAILSPVPYIGVGLVWIPTVISLFVLGNTWGGVFLLFWSLLLVANIDNLVRPYLIGGRSSLHPFAVMMMLLGGIFAFGFKGLIFGPLVLTLLLAFLHIYELEYRGGPPSTPVKKKKNGNTKKRLLAFFNIT